MKAEEMDILSQAVDGLPNEQREALVMRIYGGLTFAQIAEVLNPHPSG
jgi:DNA-directed RNA polymerase specialized sigma24 family protein